MGLNPGSPGFSLPQAEDDQVRKLRDQERTTRENAAARTLEASQIGKGGIRVTDGGSITVEAPGTIDLSGGSFSAANVSASSGVTAGGNVVAGGTVQGAAVVSTGGISAAGSFSASGNATVSAQVNAVGSLRSVGAFNTDVSIYPGARQPMWQNNNGMIGYAPSTRVKKTNVRNVPFTAENVRACIPRIFAYSAQVDIRDNPDNEFYDPTYVVPDEAGLFAEDLIENGLEAFVIYENDGVTPAGIDYAGFGAVANLVVTIDLHERLTKLEKLH